jgi:hypothetical protein
MSVSALGLRICRWPPDNGLTLEDKCAKVGDIACYPFNVQKLKECRKVDSGSRSRGSRGSAGTGKVEVFASDLSPIGEEPIIQACQALMVFQPKLRARFLMPNDHVASLGWSREVLIH